MEPAHHTMDARSSSANKTPHPANLLVETDQVAFVNDVGTMHFFYSVLFVIIITYEKKITTF